LFLPLELPVVNHLFNVFIVQTVGLMSFAVDVPIEILFVERVVQHENTIPIPLTHLTQSALNK